MASVAALLAPVAIFGASPTAIAKEAIDPARMVADVKTLASDTFEGRAPGTVGEERTIGYLIARFQDIGLQPAGPNGQWVQNVPLLHTKLQAPKVLSFNGPKGAMPVEVAKDIYLSTVRPDDTARIAGAPVVFVGYGVKPPNAAGTISRAWTSRARWSSSSSTIRTSAPRRANPPPESSATGR